MSRARGGYSHMDRLARQRQRKARLHNIPTGGALAWRIAGIIFIVLACVVLGTCVAKAATVTLTDDVIVPNAQRLGINLGGPNDYGAENWLRNMVMNPGMEPGTWGAVISTRGAKEPTDKLQADYWSTAWHTPNIGQPVGHWDGGTWELPLQGLSGKIIAFTHDDSRYTWQLDRVVTAAWHEPLFVRRVDPANGHEPRPGSTGVQSRYITAKPAWETTGGWTLDALAKQGDSTAGKMRLIRGPHVARFWAKGPAVVNLRVERAPGGPVMLDHRFTLTSDWQEYSVEFDAADPYQSGVASPIGIGWRFTSGAGMWLDDLYIGPTGPGAFTDDLVEAVRALRPGVIRGWQGFHGDTLAGLLSDQYARGPREYRPRYLRATAYGYGIPDLLALCREVGALPWIVLPPTLTDSEMSAFGVWLADNASDFPTVYVEYANEAWGSNNPHSDPFAGSSFDGGAWLGAAAHRAFEAMQPPANVIKVIGGQAAWAGQNDAIRKAAPGDYVIPIAPYFGKLHQAWGTPEEMFYPVFGEAFLKPQPNLPVYEINFHTTGGAKGDKAIVNSFVASQAGGLALILHTLERHTQPQAVFTLSQYSTAGIRMWGVYRDIMATGRLRGTGWAMALVNQATRGDRVAVTVEGAPTITAPGINGLEKAGPQTFDALRAYGWRDGDGWAVVLVNLSMTDTIPVDGLEPDEAMILTTDEPTATNEDAQVFGIEPHEWAGSVPPHTAVLLTGTNHIVEPTEMTVTVPPGVSRVVLEIEP